MKRYNILCFVLLIGITLCGCRHILQKHQKQNNSWIRWSMNPMMTLNCHFNHQSVKNNVFFAEHRLVVFWNIIENSIRLRSSIGPICQSLTPRIREYDDDGNEKIDSGHMSTMVNSFGEDYGSIMTYSQPDRCIAEPNIHIGEKDTIDCESLTDQLCQDCLDKVCEFYS